MPECRQVHTHEGKKSTEIEKLSRMLICVSNIVQPDSTAIGNRTHQKNVVGRRICLRVDMSKEVPRQDTVSSHPEKKTRRSQTAGECTAQGRQYQHTAHGLE